MISYILNRREEITQVKKCCDLLNSLKKRLKSGNFNQPYNEFEQAQTLFESIQKIAIELNDERFANSLYVFKEYFKLFCNIGQYFFTLQNKEYRESWNRLQDCLGNAKHLGRFIELPERLEVPDIIDLLISYEKLYPFNIFSSSEYVVSKSHCSICGKSMLGLDCPHIKGNLYWGEVAIEVIDEIATLQAICIVKNPEDKRCILESQDDTITDEIKFKKIDKFFELKAPLLQIFRIEENIEIRRDSSIQEVGRNAPCSCGSGKKFKKCCYNKMYYKHLILRYVPVKKIEFIIL